MKTFGRRINISHSQHAHTASWKNKKDKHTVWMRGNGKLRHYFFSNKHCLLIKIQLIRLPPQQQQQQQQVLTVQSGKIIILQTDTHKKTNKQKIKGQTIVFF